MALSRIAEAYVQVVPRIDGVAAQLNSQLGTEMAAAGVAGGDKMAKGTAQGFGSKIKGYFAPVAATFAASFAAVGISNFLKESVAAASNFGESANAVNVAYGKAAPQIAALGEDAANRLGLSARAFNEIATRFSGFAGTIAGEGGNVAKVIDDLSTRGADFASVFNINVDEALTLFQSGLAGETEPLRRYGIDLSAATVENFAFAKGIAEKGKKLTEAQKVQARYALLLESTSKVQGDFANTSDSLANQQRILAANLEESQRKLGDKLLPIMNALVGFTLNSVLPAFDGFVTALTNTFNWIDENKAVVGTFVGVLGGLLVVFNAAAIATKAWAAAQAILNAIMAINPLTLVAIAVAALVAGIVYLATQTTFFQDLWRNFTKFVGEAWQNVVKFFQDSARNISNFFSKMWDGIKGFFRDALNTIVQLFLNWTVLGWIIKNWGNIVEFFSTAWDKIVNFFSTALGNIVRFVSDGIGKVITFFRELPGKILSALGNLGKSLVQLGKDMIQGLLDGAGSLLPRIGEFFLDMLPGWIVEPFKKALGIASPSKLFKQFGKDIIRGLTGGLMDGEDSIRSTMTRVKDEVVKLFEDGKISRAAKAEALSLARTFETMLVSTQKMLDATNKKLDDAQAKLEDRIRERQDFVNQIATQFGSTGLNLTPGEGDKSVVDQLKERIAKSKELRKVTDQLTAMGLDKSLIRQIVETQAVDFGQSIVAGGKAAVDELNVLADEANVQAKKLAEQVGSVLFDEGIEFSRSVVQGLRDRKQELEDLMKSVAQTFSRELQGLMRDALQEGPQGEGQPDNKGGNQPDTGGGKKDEPKKGEPETKKRIEVAKAQANAIVKDLNNSMKVTKKAVAPVPTIAKKFGNNIAGAIKAVERASATPVKTVARSADEARAANLRKFATGGFVTGPTRALIGEAGPEVVYPLKDFERVMGIGEGQGKTLVYNAAPNASIDNERALFQAIKRAEVIAGW